MTGSWTLNNVKELHDCNNEPKSACHRGWLHRIFKLHINNKKSFI